MDMTMKKMTKRRLQAIETKSRIYKTGMKIINENGFAKTSIDMVCEACGISKGAYYHHYKSKVGLLLESGQQVVDALKQETEETKGLPVQERFISYLICYAENMEQTGLEFIRECTKYVISADYKDVEDEHSIGSSTRINIEHILKDGIANGELMEDVPIDVILDVVDTVTNGFNSRWCVQNGRYSIKDDVVKCSDLYRQILAPYIIK
jgi:TetR/AcrR family transcriptional regulator, fatty acid metabolism regulator protein